MRFPKRYDGELRETLFRSQGSQVSMRMAMGSAAQEARFCLGPISVPGGTEGTCTSHRGQVLPEPALPVQGLKPLSSELFSYTQP